MQENKTITDTIFYSWYKNKSVINNKKQFLFCVSTKTWWNKNHCFGVSSILSDILIEMGCLRINEFLYSTEMSEKDFRAYLKGKDLSIVKNKEFNKFATEFIESHKLDLIETSKFDSVEEDEFNLAINSKIVLNKKPVIDKIIDSKTQIKKAKSNKTCIASSRKHMGGWRKTSNWKRPRKISVQ